MEHFQSSKYGSYEFQPSPRNIPEGNFVRNVTGKIQRNVFFFFFLNINMKMLRGQSHCQATFTKRLTEKPNQFVTNLGRSNVLKFLLEWSCMFNLTKMKNPKF